jgi:ribonuclease Z
VISSLTLGPNGLKTAQRATLKRLIWWPGTELNRRRQPFQCYVNPAVGYRFDYKGRSVVFFSGDTIRWPNVVTHAANADVLIRETQSEEAKRILVQAFRRNGQDQLAEVMTGTSRYHTTALDAASVANEANVRLLVFDHLGPSPPDNLLTRLIFARGLNKIRPQSQWRIGFDGMIIDLPAGARAIQFAPKLR